MKDKYSVLQIIFGILIVPILLSMLIFDRMICTACVWIQPPTIVQFYSDWKQFMLSVYRISFVSLLIGVIYLITLFL
jgi:hypothetical protein